MTSKYLLLAMLASAVPVSAGSYLVTINTTSVSSVAGSLFFAYGPGAPPFDLATATITNFTGGTLGAVLVTGGVGTLPGSLALSNASPQNYQQAFTYGNSISFKLSLTGPALSTPSALAIGGTDLALYLLDGSDNPLLTDDPNGSIVDFSIAPKTGQVTYTTFPNAGGSTVAAVVPLPEPGSLLLLLSGAGVFLYRRKSIA